MAVTASNTTAESSGSGLASKSSSLSSQETRKLTSVSAAATYTLIYSFLKKNSHAKAADAIRKAAKDVVALEGDMDVDGPSLDEIIKQWQTLTTSS